jgi:hypothetical protein
MCRFKQIVTRRGDTKNECVVDSNALTMDPDCKYNFSTGKCIINRENVPAKKKTYRRSPVRQQLQNMYQPFGAYIQKQPVSKGECRYKTSINAKGIVTKGCVQDKNLTVSDSRCKRSSYGRCILAKAEPLMMPKYVTPKMKSPVQPKREYIKYAANKQLADQLRQLQMRPLTKTPIINYSIPPPPPPYTESILARKSRNFM